MKVNEKLLNLFLMFGICGMDEEINSYNRYLGRLQELKLELDDAMFECDVEIERVEQERRPF
jgi:hypothetical protein